MEERCRLRCVIPSGQSIFFSHNSFKGYIGGPSALVGYEKPSENIFPYLPAVSGQAPSQILHVGDRIEGDIRGAEKAGLRAALHGTGNILGGALPAVQVQSLREIPKLRRPAK